jgi:hypothetical protein
VRVFRKIVRDFRKNILIILKDIKFCQSTRSKHGNNIREYFLDIEYILNKYKNYIIEGLADKIDEVTVTI